MYSTNFHIDLHISILTFPFRAWDHKSRRWFYHSSPNTPSAHTGHTGGLVVATMVVLLWLYSFYRWFSELNALTLSVQQRNFFASFLFIRITILKYPGIKDNNTREYKSYHGMIPRLWMVWAYTLNFDGVGCFRCFMIYWINIQMGSFLGVHFPF